MMPSRIALDGLMTLKTKATLRTIFIAMVAVSVIIFAPTDSPKLNRMRSTFDSNDESPGLRDINRKFIQPYIYAHLLAVVLLPQVSKGNSLIRVIPSPDFPR